MCKLFDFRIGDPATQRLCETMQRNYLEWPAKEPSHRRRERFSDFESIMHGGHQLVSFSQPPFAFGPVLGELRSKQAWRERLRAVQPRESHTEPFRVGRILPLHEKT